MNEICSSIHTSTLRSHPVQNGLQKENVPSCSCTMGIGSFPGVKLPGRGADHPPLLAPRSRKSRAIPLPPLWAFESVTGYLYLFYPSCSARLHRYKHQLKLLGSRNEWMNEWMNEQDGRKKLTHGRVPFSPSIVPNQMGKHGLDWCSSGQGRVAGDRECFLYIAENFLLRWGPVSFSGRILLHGVSCYHKWTSTWFNPQILFTTRTNNKLYISYWTINMFNSAVDMFIISNYVWWKGYCTVSI
jgi:hypothetical protein